MVQQNIKVNEYRFINSGTSMATGEKQQPISAKKVALRDLSKEPSNVVSKPALSSPLSKDQGPISDAVKVSGSKRETSSSPSSPARSQPPASSGANRHLVYVRRKLETEPGKMDGSDSRLLKKTSNDRASEPVSQPVLAKAQPEQGGEANASSVFSRKDCSNSGSLRTCEPVAQPVPPRVQPAQGGEANCSSSSGFAQKMDSSDSQGLRKSETITQPVLPRVPPEQAREANVSSFPVFASVPPVSLNTSSGLSAPARSLGKPLGGLAAPAPNYSTITTAVPVQPESQRWSDQHWKERFVRLQMFLKSCDQSSQDEYIRRLRSLTATARSQHAYELEERAIHLLFEEGKELHRMKVLNVLGKASPDSHASTSTQIRTPAQMAPEK